MNQTPDLGTRVMNRLQDRKRGQTMQELMAYTGEPESKIRVALRPYVTDGQVVRSKSGVWTLVRD